METTRSISERLKALRERADFSVRELAEAIGLPGSTYATYERRTYKKEYLPASLVLKLRNVLAGRGEPPIQDDEVLSLSGISSSSEQTGHKSTSDHDSTDGISTGHELVITEYAVRAQAGGGAEMPELDADGNHLVVGRWIMPSDMVLAHTLPDATLAVIRVEGDSMEPDYQAGDRVLVDRSSRSPSPPGVYVLWDGFGLVLKRLELLLRSSPPRVRLSSINPAYATYEAPLADVVIQGRVVGKWMWK